MPLDNSGSDNTKMQLNSESIKISRSLLNDVQKYIDEVYVESIPEESDDGDYFACVGAAAEDFTEEEQSIELPVRVKAAMEDACVGEEAFSSRKYKRMAFAGQQLASKGVPSLEDWMENMDASFSETLLHLIDAQGKTDSEVYRKANVDRKLFSKIRNNPEYQPRKTTALAFAVALELDLDETKEFIGRAGYALSHSSKLDIVVEYFIMQKNYDIFTINEALLAFDQPLLGC